MDTKKQKSIDTVKERLDRLEMSIDIPLDLDYMSILLKGQSPQYHIRFAAWARNTLDKDEHMYNFVHALLAKFALDLILYPEQFTEEFVRGQINSVLFLVEEMERLSNPNTFISDKKKS